MPMLYRPGIYRNHYEGGPRPPSFNFWETIGFPFSRLNQTASRRRQARRRERCYPLPRSGASMVERIVLRNGVRVLLEQMPNLRSVSLGVCVESGARHEPPELAGISHFLEHMLFKGTVTRSTRDIAREFDLMGGRANAATEKDYTFYYTKTLDYHRSDAMEILGDMLLHSRFDPKDVSVEKNVVLEEINMNEDSPETLVSDQLFEEVWRENTLGCNILGNPETLSRITPETLREHVERHYVPERTILSIAGSFDREQTLSEAGRLFGGFERRGTIRSQERAAYLPGIILKEKDVEQNHLCLGFEGFPAVDDRKYALSVISNLLGSGMSSRLMQRLREEHGLVYSVETFVTDYRDAGVFGVYAAYSSEAEDEVLSHIMEELRLIRSEGITEDELRRAKEYFKTGLVMALEGSFSRMTNNALYELMDSPILTSEQIIEKIDAVDL
ncbi:MAG: insulinase family protein, partial [Clostridia bacterium]|nr:insulinase family protein [Clostridia bacterium]